MYYVKEVTRNIKPVQVPQLAPRRLDSGHGCFTETVMLASKLPHD